MSSLLQAAVKKFLDAAHRATSTANELAESADAVIDMVERAPKTELDPAIRSITERLDGVRPDVMGMMALMSGALVEAGGTPDLVYHALKSRMIPVLADATKFVDACWEQAPSEQDYFDDHDTDAGSLDAPNEDDTNAGPQQQSLGKLLQLPLRPSAGPNHNHSRGGANGTGHDEREGFSTSEPEPNDHDPQALIDSEDEDDFLDDHDDVVFVDGKAITPELRESVAAIMPNEQMAFDTAGDCCMALVAALSRAPNLRTAIRSEDALIDGIVDLSEALFQADLLTMLLAVMDREPLIVLHPHFKRGYRVEISGVADNFQLHALLMATLIGNKDDGKLPGKRPPQDVIDVFTGVGPQRIDKTVNGEWALFHWTAWFPKGRLDEGNEDHWIWHEGIPADIRTFEGTRVVLLGRPGALRRFPAQRMFAALPASVNLLQTLSPAAVRDWLDRLQRGPQHPAVPKA